MPHFAITRQQRVALFEVFRRDFPGWITPTKRLDARAYQYAPGISPDRHPVRVPSTQWRRFRSRVQPSFGCDGMVTIHWRGMWLAIERDGFVHS